MQAPASDWFPSRVDLRAARRWERARGALTVNLLFLFCLFAFGWLGIPRNDTVAIGFLFALLPIGVSFRGLSFLDLSRRKQLARAFGGRGCHVEGRYSEGDLEIGRDFGYLMREGGLLRFEGTRTRFAIAASSLTETPDLSGRNPEFFLGSYRIYLKPERTADVDEAAALIGRWLREGGEVSGERMPPQAPQARTWNCYLYRGAERHTLLLSGLMVPIIFLQHAIPKEWGLARSFLITSPLLFFGIATAISALRIRREDQVRLATRTTTKEPILRAIPIEEEPAAVLKVGTP